MATVGLHEYITVVTGYKYVVMENGSIVPVLRVNDVDTVIGRVRHVMLKNWADFDMLEPRIGNKIKLVYNNYGFKEVIKIDSDFGTEPISRPKCCPLCLKPLNISDSKANSPVIRCNNEMCKHYDIRGIVRYLKFCSLVTELSYTDISRLCLKNVITNILDLYKLTTDNLVSCLGITPEKAKEIIEKIHTNINIPIQNLIYTMLPKCHASDVVKLASIIAGDNWLDPIIQIKKTICLSRRDTNDPKLARVVLEYNSEISRNRKLYQELAKIITVKNLLELPSMYNKLIVIGNINSVTKAYLEIIIKLNGGRTEDNFNTLVWGDVNFIITDGPETNQNIIEGIDLKILTIKEVEFRGIVGMEYANEPSQEDLNDAKRRLGLVVEDDVR